MTTSEMYNGGQNAVHAAASGAKLKGDSSEPLQSGASFKDKMHSTGILSVDGDGVKSIANTYNRGTSMNCAEYPLGISGIIKVTLMFKKKISVAIFNEHSTLNPKLKLQENVQQTRVERPG